MECGKKCSICPFESQARTFDPDSFGDIFLLHI